MKCTKCGMIVSGIENYGSDINPLCFECSNTDLECAMCAQPVSLKDSIIKDGRRLCNGCNAKLQIKKHNQPLIDLKSEDAIKVGLRLARENLGFYIPVIIIIALFFAAQLILSPELRRLFDKNVSLPGPLSVGLNLAFNTFLGSIIAMGLASTSLTLLRCGKVRLLDFFVTPHQVFMHFITTFLVYMFTYLPLKIPDLLVLIGRQYPLALYAARWLPMLLGFLCMYNGLRLQFYTYLLCDYKFNPHEIVYGSWILGKNHILSTLGLNFRLVFLNLAGFLCLGVGLFITLPATFIALAHRYSLLRLRREDEDASRSKSQINST